MCLSELGQVVRYEPSMLRAHLDIDGRPQTASTVALGLEPAALSPGTWVLVHTGLVVEVLSDEAAERIHALRSALAGSIPKEN